MKHRIQSFQLGQVEQAQVVEAVGAEFFIVNFYGDLLRVRNGTKKDFRPGEWIQLVVTSIYPLSFQLYETSTKDSKTLDIRA